MSDKTFAERISSQNQLTLEGRCIKERDHLNHTIKKLRKMSEGFPDDEFDGLFSCLIENLIDARDRLEKQLYARMESGIPF